MHEFSLADDLIRSATELAAPHPGRVVEVELVVGALTAVNPEALDMAFHVLQEGTRLAEARLVCRLAPVTLACRSCGREGEPEDPLLLRCSVCGSGAVGVTSGRQLDIVRLRLEE
jgi:hydrogenase nickel incorporation protein HypA/HybF